MGSTNGLMHAVTPITSMGNWSEIVVAFPTNTSAVSTITTSFITTSSVDSQLYGGGNAIAVVAVLIVSIVAGFVVLARRKSPVT